MNYTISGNGSSVILFIHGYCSDFKAWDKAKLFFEKTNRVIIVSIPGYLSPMEQVTESVRDLALSIKSILEIEKITRAHIVGHSMGGYIGVEFLSIFEENVQGLTLLNSHCYNDAEDKKTNRQKTIEFLLKHGTGIYLREIYKSLFSIEYQEKNRELIETLNERVKTYDVQVLIQSCKAMINRKNHEETLKNTKVPIQFILGAKDGLIPIDEFIKQTALPKVAEIELYPKMGHMGMYEEAEATNEKIKSFNNYVTNILVKV